MKRILKLVILLSFMALSSACAAPKPASTSVAEPAYWPTAGWQTATPESQGMDSNKLAQMLEQIAANQINFHSILVIRNGYLVSETYFQPYTAQTREHVQSVTKSITGALVGIAVMEKQIKSVDETLLSYFPDHRIANPSREKESIQIKDLLSMSSGLDCQEFSEGPTMEQAPNWVQYVLDLPAYAPPGETFRYCNGNAHLLSAIIEKSTGLNTREYANRKLFNRLGIQPVEATNWGSDPQGITTGGYGLYLTPEELAKFAFLYLHNGKWDGQQILPSDWVTTSFSQAVQKEDGSGYGYLWTVYPSAGHSAALGLGGQQIHIYPAKNLIVVTTAGLEAYAEAPEIETLLTDSILPAIQADTPLAANPDGLKRLQQAQEQAANPIQPVPPLPARALEISGKTYHFTENPVGWETVELVFTPGADYAELKLNSSSPIQIGLDNLYRLTKSELLGEIFLRARWVDESTLVADYPYGFGSNRLGDLGHTQFQFKFLGDKVEVTVRQLIFGGEPLVFSGSM